MKTKFLLWLFIMSSNPRLLEHAQDFSRNTQSLLDSINNDSHSVKIVLETSFIAILSMRHSVANV